MSSEAKHRARAARNTKFALESQTNGYPDWAVTAGFYAAVHHVEGLFARDLEFHSRDHRGRNQRLKKSFPQLWKVYRKLFAASMVARYHCHEPITRDDVTRALTKFLPEVEKLTSP